MLHSEPLTAYAVFVMEEYMIIIFLIIGYFIGLISAVMQVIYMEKRYSKKLEDIMKTR